MNNHDDYNAPITLEKMVKMVEAYVSATSENATSVNRDRDYFDGKQISSTVRQQMNARGQPTIYVNKISPALNGLLGIMDAAESNAECFPRNDRASNSADLATQVLRYITDQTNFSRIRKQCSENYLIQGVAAAIVEWNGERVKTTRIRWEDFIYDPLSKEHDFLDAKWLGLAKMMEIADVRAMFGDDETSDGDFSDFGLFDRNNTKQSWWSHQGRKQVRVVDLYFERDGIWHHAIFTRGKLLSSGLSEYKDEFGRPACPIVATSYEVSRDGDRYGAIRHMIPLQDEVNARRSKMLHIINNRQVKITDPQMVEANEKIARQEAARPDGVLPAGFDMVSTSDMAQGQMLILSQSMADLDRMAPTPAVLGKASGSRESGRARQILQQAGYTELARAFGRYEAFDLAIFRRMWLTAQHYMTGETLIRIVDDPRAPEFVKINEPVFGPTMVPVTDPATGEAMLDENGQPATMAGIGEINQKNRLAELDMDIIISTVPDPITLEHETWEAILEYSASVGVSVFDPRFTALLEISPLPNKRRTIDKIKRLVAEFQSQPDPMAEAMKQHEVDKAEAQAAQINAKAMKDIAVANKIATEIGEKEVSQFENPNYPSVPNLKSVPGLPYNGYR